MILLRMLCDDKVVRFAKGASSAALSAWWRSNRPSDCASGLEEGTWIKPVLLGQKSDPLLLAMLLATFIDDLELARELDEVGPLQASIMGGWETQQMKGGGGLERSIWTGVVNGDSVRALARRAGVSEASLRHHVRQEGVSLGLRAENKARADIHARRAVVHEAINAGASSRADLMLVVSAEVRWLDIHDSLWIRSRLSQLYSRASRNKQTDLFTASSR